LAIATGHAFGRGCSDGSLHKVGRSEFRGQGKATVSLAAFFLISSKEPSGTRGNKSKPTMEAQAAEGSETMVVRHTLHPDLLLGVDRGLNFDLGNLAAFSYQPIDPSVAK